MLSILALLPFLGNPDRIRLDSLGVVSKLCFSLTSAPLDALNMIAPPQPTGGTACREFVFGVDNGTTFTLIYGVTKTANSVTQHEASFPVNDFGSPVTPFMPQSLLIAALLISVGSWLLREGRQSPGKTVLGLRVEGGQKHPFRREALKYVSLLISGTFSISIWAFGTPIGISLAGWSFSSVLICGVFIGLMMLAYYGLPWIRWRGAMPWDHLSGSCVQRKV